jgi:GNAT superfamily N-acetyltransferase
MKIRPAQPADVAPALAMFDGIMEWLVGLGRTEQWGTEPWSKQRQLIQRVEDRVTRGELRVAVEPGGEGPGDEEILGVISLSSQCSDYVSPPPEPEVFINLLGTSRKAKGQDVGGALIDEARDEARRRGVRLLRVDCFAGADGKLRAWYESQGFEAVEPFTVRRPGRADWPGMLLQQYLEPR